MIKIELRGQAVELLREKALFHPGESLLVIADVHLGKARHFRREGVAIPAHVQQEDYKRLDTLLRQKAPRSVYFLGDLFHSKLNHDWHYFSELIAAFPDIQFTLIKGNHDIIDERQFTTAGIVVVDEIETEHFLFTHEPVEETRGKLNIAGHIHPGFVLSGMANQSIKLPCFYLTGELMLMPAFGVLTGLYSIAAKKGASVFLVLPDGIKHIH